MRGSGRILFDARLERCEGGQSFDGGDPINVKPAQFVDHAGLDWREEVHLLAESVRLAGVRQARLTGIVEFTLLEVEKNLPGAADYRVGKPREPRHFDSIAPRRRLIDDPAKEQHLPAPFAHRHAEILHART